MINQNRLVGREEWVTNSKSFTCTSSLKPYNNLVARVLLLFPFYRWGSWGRERLRNILNIIEQSQDLNAITLTPETKLLTIYYVTSCIIHIFHIGQMRHILFFAISSPLQLAAGCDGKNVNQKSENLVLVLKQLLVISCFGSMPSLNKSFDHHWTQFLHLQNGRTGLMFSNISTIQESVKSVLKTLGNRSGFIDPMVSVGTALILL